MRAAAPSMLAHTRPLIYNDITLLYRFVPSALSAIHIIAYCDVLWLLHAHGRALAFSGHTVLGW